MKGGQVPVHIQRWCPADFQMDPFVQWSLAAQRWDVYVLYRQFLDISFAEGGSIPDDLRYVRAICHFEDTDTAERALVACVEAGKIIRDNGRLYHPRVRREVQRELDLRTTNSNASRTRSAAVRIEQARTAGLRSAEARAAKYGSAQPFPRTERPVRTSGSNVPPTPTPTPTPTESVVGSVSVVGTEIIDPKRNPIPAPVVAGKSWTREAAEDWEARYGKGSSQPGRIGAALTRLVKAHGWDRIRPVWRRYLAEKDPQYATPQDFAAKAGAWAEGSAGADDLESHNARAAAQARAMHRAEEHVRDVTPEPRKGLPSGAGFARVLPPRKE